ncbi:hypothetical protein [Allopontixanthobacter sediminis]|uniref:hypothetical protein n=1 Tax=Allopontixanthobacter sediminis TaxID=1689985 RepID=UPI0019263F00|nr:hypothetical protein [Allopontixanthobacter sediminis]
MEQGAFDNLGWVEIIFTSAVALGIGFWQLWSVNREIAKDKEKAAARDAQTGTEAEGD